MICTRCESEQREPRDSLRALIALNVSRTRFQGFCRFLQNEPKTSGEENFKFVICGSSVSLGLYANPLFGRGEEGRAGWVGRSRVWWGPRGSLRTGAGAERGEAASPGEGRSGRCGAGHARHNGKGWRSVMDRDGCGRGAAGRGGAGGVVRRGPGRGGLAGWGEPGLHKASRHSNTGRTRLSLQRQPFSEQRSRAALGRQPLCE